MLQLLVIASDPDLRVARTLRNEGHSVTTERPDADTDQLMACAPDLVVIDCTGGLNFARWFPAFRDQHGLDRLPCLLVVEPADMPALAKDGTRSDFVVQSNDQLPEVELAARVRRLARLHAPHKTARVIEVEALVIDRDGYEVRVEDRLLELTYQEFLLLSFLAANRGKVFTRAQLLDRVWGYNYFGGTRTVDIHIRRIRAKLAPGYDRYIQTIRQVGYKFAQEIRP